MAWSHRELFKEGNSQYPFPCDSETEDEQNVVLRPQAPESCTLFVTEQDIDSTIERIYMKIYRSA